MSSLRYWLCGLIGVTLAACCVIVVSLLTWALVRLNECVPGDTRGWCEMSGDNGGGGAALLIGLALFVAIPIASWIFALRTKPRSSQLGLLAFGLAVFCGGGAALWAGVDDRGGSSTTELIGLGVGVPALVIGLFMIMPGLASMGRRVSRSQARVAGEAVLAANGGDLRRSLAAIRTAQTQQRAAGGAGHGGGGQAKQVQLGALAAQLSQIADAGQRSGGDQLAAKLRQLDDLRKSGLLSAEEHARKRRELLDQL